MTKYEIALVISGKLEEEAKKAELDKVLAYVTRFNGVVLNIDDWGRRKFAYEIQKMKEGFYYFIQFETEDNTTSNEIEARLRLMENVVRYLIVKQEA